MIKSGAEKLALVLVMIALVGCGPEGVSVRLAEAEPAPAVVPESRLPPVIAKLRNTHYYTIFEADYAGAANADVYDIHGAVIATVPQNFYKDLLMEGSGKLRNGKVLNFASKVGGTFRYEFSPNPWGNGVGRCALKPFHTIAVDRTVIPIGSLIYIDETKGMPLPDGTLHDGTWRADDIGSMIQKDRVDLYIGMKKWNTTLGRFKIDHLQALRVRILALPNAQSCAH